MTRGDKALIGILLFLNLILFTQFFKPNQQGSWALIEVNQQETHRLPLSHNQIVHVQGTIGETEVEITDGKVRILRSPCSKKLCIKSGFIQYADKLAACLPNRVVVRIVGNIHHGVDTVLS